MKIVIDSSEIGECRVRKIFEDLLKIYGEIPIVLPPHIKVTFPRSIGKSTSGCFVATSKLIEFILVDRDPSHHRPLKKTRREITHPNEPFYRRLKSGRNKRNR